MAEMINAYSIKLINSLLLAAFFLGGYLLAKFMTTRRVKAKKMRSQYLIRLRYVFFAFFMVFFIKIWVEGFVQILAFVGFLSAALTLTQKDNLMNLIGWLIINWRGLFSEEDYVKISTHSGYVKSIGFLYFTLLEVSSEFPECATGRLIKIPNGMVSRNPITNFSHEKCVECTMNFIFDPRGNIKQIESLFERLKEEVFVYLKAKEKGISLEMVPRYITKIRQEKPAGIEMIFLFYCDYAQRATLQSRLYQCVMHFTEVDQGLSLTFD